MVSEKSLANLRKLKKGDPESKRISKLGNEAVKEKARKRRAIREDLDILLNLSLKKGQMVYSEDIQSLAEAEGKNISVQTAIDIAMVQRAMMGDVQAAQYIRDTVGEKPSDKVELDQSLTIEAWAKKNKVKL